MIYFVLCAWRGEKEEFEDMMDQFTFYPMKLVTSSFLFHDHDDDLGEFLHDSSHLSMRELKIDESNTVSHESNTVRRRLHESEVNSSRSEISRRESRIKYCQSRIKCLIAKSDVRSLFIWKKRIKKCTQNNSWVLRFNFRKFVLKLFCGTKCLL